MRQQIAHHGSCINRSAVALQILAFVTLMSCPTFAEKCLSGNRCAFDKEHVILQVAGARAKTSAEKVAQRSKSYPTEFANLDRESRHPADMPSFLQVDPGAQDYKPWRVDDLKSPADPMNEPSWVKDLGRGLTIGSLYDVRSDQPVPGYLYQKDAIDGKTRRVDTPYTALEMVSSDTMKDKFTLANVESSLALSVVVLGVETEVGASAKYLNDKAQSQKTSRVSMNYMTRSYMEHLDLYDEGLKHKMFHEPIMNGLATHVVTGVLWGGNCYAIFEADSDSVEEKQNTEASLRNMVKVNTPMFGFGSELDLHTKVSNTYKEVVEKTTVRIYGDHVPTGPIPTDVNGALEYIQLIPQEIGKNPIPIAVQLFPLAKLDSKAAKLRQQVSDYAIESAMALFMELDELEMMVKDLTIIKEDGFVLWKENVRNYLAELRSYRMKVMLRLGGVLKDVRDSDTPQDQLLEPVREHTSSEYSKEKVTNRVRVFSDQIYNLKAWVKVLVDDGVRIAYSFSDFTAKTFDGDYTDVYVLIFRGMNPSADRQSSSLMRRFRRFAVNRKWSKNAAFLFVHYDSFKQEFSIEAAMSSPRANHAGETTALLQADENSMQPQTGDSLLPGWRAHPDGGFVHNATGTQLVELHEPHAYPPHHSGASLSSEAIAAATYTEIPGSTWLQGNVQSDDATHNFYWDPTTQHFSWHAPVGMLQQEQGDRATMLSMLARERQQEHAAAKRRDFKEAKRLKTLLQQHEQSDKTLQDLDSQIETASKVEDYEKADQLMQQYSSLKDSVLSGGADSLPGSCAAQGLHLADIGCQALLPPQCRAADFMSAACKTSDSQLCATLQEAREKFKSTPCVAIRSKLPEECSTVSITSDVCRVRLPARCSGNTPKSADAALESTECLDDLRAHRILTAHDSCMEEDCMCGLPTSMSRTLCCDRRTKRTQKGVRSGSAWCRESPCNSNEQAWCEKLDSYAAWHAAPSAQDRKRALQLNLTENVEVVGAAESSEVSETGRCVESCTKCEGDRTQAVNHVCEKATPDLCYHQAGGLLYCPPSKQCMSECAACVDYEDKDTAQHSCVKRPSPSVCFEERGGMLFCPSSRSCMQANKCQTSCVDNPKRDYILRQCSTGATLESPLRIVGTPTRDSIRVEFEAAVPEAGDMKNAYASIMLVKRAYQESEITASALWRLARSMADEKHSECVVAGQLAPLSPRKASWILKGCNLDVDVQYNLFMALSDDALDATDALLTVVPMRVPQPVRFASQATAILDPTQARLMVSFLVEEAVALPGTDPSSVPLLGWAWLLPSRLLACCLNTTSARLTPAALNARLLDSGLESGEAEVLEGLLACSNRASPVQAGTRAVWTIDCQGPLQTAAQNKISLGVRVLVAEDGLTGDGGSLTPTLPVVQPPPCDSSEISVNGGRFGCSHLTSVEDGFVCEVVPDVLPGLCTHYNLTCKGGQWVSCTAPSNTGFLDSVNSTSSAHGMVPSDCTMTTSVTCSSTAAATTTLVPLTTRTALISYASPSATQLSSKPSFSSGSASNPMTAASGLTSTVDGVMNGASSGQSSGAATSSEKAEPFMDTVKKIAQAITIAQLMGSDSPAVQQSAMGAMESASEGVAGVVSLMQANTTSILGNASSKPLSFLQSSMAEVSTPGKMEVPCIIENSFSGRRLFAGPLVESTWNLAEGFGATTKPVQSEQLWWLHRQSDGTYKLVNMQSSRKIYAQKNKNYEAGVFASVNEWGTNRDKLWWLEKLSDGTFNIVNADSERVLYAWPNEEGLHGFGAFKGDSDSWGEDTHWTVTPVCTIEMHGGDHYDGWNVVLPEGSYDGAALREALPFELVKKGSTYCKDGELWSGWSAGQDDCESICQANPHCSFYSYWTVDKRRWCRTTQTCASSKLDSGHSISVFKKAEPNIGSLIVYGKDCSVTAYQSGNLVGGERWSLLEGMYDNAKLAELDTHVGSLHVQVVVTTTTTTTTTTTAESGKSILVDGETRPSPDNAAAITTTTTSPTTSPTPYPTPEPHKPWLETSRWGHCSQPCGSEGVRERRMLCYKNSQIVDLEECGEKESRPCISAAFGGDNNRCDVEECNRIDCVDFAAGYGVNETDRSRYNGKRCKSSARHARTPLKVMASDAQSTSRVYPQACAVACRQTPGCVYFTVLALGNKVVVADVPWCYGESTEKCEQSEGKGIVLDRSWNLYRLSDAANLPDATPPPPHGVITRTVVWHYRNSVLINEDFTPAYVPAAPSAPAAVARGATAGSDVDQWLQLTWDAPEDSNGAEILYYKIRRHWWQASYTTMGAAGSQSERQLTYKQVAKITDSRGPQTTNVLVSRLQAGRKYTFEVAAVNAEGDSEWSPLSGAIRMGAASASIEPKATIWSGGESVTMTLAVASETPVHQVVVSTNQDIRTAECEMVATTDPHSEFTCLTPAWSKLGTTPEKAGAVRQVTLTAYDVSGHEIAMGSLKYADYKCPAHADLHEAATATADDAECAWFKDQGMATCEFCQCSNGYQKGPYWSRSVETTGIDGLPPTPEVATPSALPSAPAPSPDASAVDYASFLFKHHEVYSSEGLGGKLAGQSSQTPSEAPPRYGESTCEQKTDYCQQLDLSNGRLPSRDVFGLKIHDVVQNLHKVCDPGYELHTDEGGVVYETVTCLAYNQHGGNYGVLGKPRNFLCAKVDKFCIKKKIQGGEVPFAVIDEAVDAICTAPNRDAWPYNPLGSSTRVTCAADGDDHTRGKFLTQALAEVDGSIQCAGCQRIAIDSDGDQGYITASRVGQRGKMHCPAGWVLSSDFKGTFGPKCLAEHGGRTDNLLGKWSFADWGGKKPKCIFADKCKDVECGTHGQCIIEDEEVYGGTNAQAMTWTKKVAKCMCVGGWRGTRCEIAPPQKCDYQIRYENHHGAQRQSLDQSVRPQLIEASQGVVATYKQHLDGDSEKEGQVVKAMMTRTAQMKNVKVCCITLDSSVAGKGGFERRSTQEFSTEIDNVQITTTGTGIEDAMQQFMTEASISLSSKARLAQQESGLMDHQVSVKVQSISADISMPVGLPPEGACLSMK